MSTPSLPPSNNNTESVSRAGTVSNNTHKFQQHPQQHQQQQQHRGHVTQASPPPSRELVSARHHFRILRKQLILLCDLGVPFLSYAACITQHALILDYLSHHCYVSTARAFARLAYGGGTMDENDSDDNNNNKNKKPSTSSSHGTGLSDDEIESISHRKGNAHCFSFTF
jgi:hypothetical protein